MPTTTWTVICTVVTITSLVALSYFKYKTVRVALKGVPSDKRADVINALSNLFHRWRWR